jgi:hypothetical protein
MVHNLCSSKFAINDTKNQSMHLYPNRTLIEMALIYVGDNWVLDLRALGDGDW